MDEKTLNDLLECSVCLERLDTSSKVLPCQHTFCRKCLEVIVQSHQELRCPECRILVDLKIDELPPNVLLMRILEGMKNSASHTIQQHIHNQQQFGGIGISVGIGSGVSGGGGGLINVGNLKSPKNLINLHHNTGLNQLGNNSSKIITNNHNILRGGGGGGSDPNNDVLRNKFSNKHPLSGVPHAKALYDFTSKEAGDLSFKMGEIIVMRKILDHNWCIGELNGREGAFPINHVDVIIPLPIPQCKALYDFRMGPNEEEGCLIFKKGAIIQVLRRVDQNWAEGKLAESIGIFPIAFVEMNLTARQLMDASAKHVQHNSSRIVPPKPFENVSSDTTSSSATTSPNSSSTSNTSSNSSTAPSSPTAHLNQPAQNRDANKEKRHSLTTLIGHTNQSNLIQQSSNRHSAEILSTPTSSTNETTRTHSDNNKQVVKPSLTQQQRAKLIHQKFSHFPIACEAVYSYKPQNSDELELKKGSIYYVTERCKDGWLKGNNRSKKVGVFPGNYVVPISRSRENNIIHSSQHQQRLQQSQNTTTNSGPSSVPGLISNHPNAGHVPPELPPRNNSPSSSTAIWMKQLGPIDSIFNRKTNQTSNNNQIKNSTTHSSQNSAGNNTKSNELTGSTNHALNNNNNTSNAAKDKKECSSAVSLMKRLTNIKRSKSPTNPLAFSMDNPVFEDTPSTMPSIITTPSSSSKHSIQIAHPVHVRSGSCPSQLLQNLPKDNSSSNSHADKDTGSSSFLFGSKRIKPHKERPSLQELRSNTSDASVNSKSNSAGGPSISRLNQNGTHGGGGAIHSNKISSSYHRKSQSLDATTISSQLNGGTPSKTKVHRNERFRCIVPYPPNSEYELELHVGDIVCVHKKRENGWYKGTHQRTGKVGLFPASFVEPDI